jgi:hypothetical protein
VARGLAWPASARRPGRGALVDAAHLLGGAQGGEHQPALLDLDGADAFARAHHQAAGGHHVLLGHGGANDGIGFDAGLARGDEMVRHVPIKPVDRGAGNEATGNLFAFLKP